MNDKEQPPRSLHARMKELEKIRSKRNKKKGDEKASVKTSMGSGGSIAEGIAADLTNTALSPLERLHVAQQRTLTADGGVASMLQNPEANSLPMINIKNKCMPEKVDLPAVLDAVNHQANQLAHSGTASRGTTLTSIPNNVISTSSGGAQYGDGDTFPTVFVTSHGDILLAMSVDGITCAHCVKIVETVLKGCNGNKSPIDGLLDAAADRDLCSVLVKIENISVSKRVAFEAARNLAMVGYTAKAKVISVLADQDGQKKLPEYAIVKAFDAVARTDPQTLFDWKVPCSCPDNGVLRSDCSR